MGVAIPKAKPNGKGLYLKDRREGKFYLLWREGQKRRYQSVEEMLAKAIAAKDKKENTLSVSSLDNIQHSPRLKKK